MNHFVPNVKEFELEVEDFILDDEIYEWNNVTFLVRWDDTNEKFYPIRAYYDDNHMLDMEGDNPTVFLFRWQWEENNLSEYAWNEYQKRYV